MSPLRISGLPQPPLASALPHLILARECWAGVKRKQQGGADANLLNWATILAQGPGQVLQCQLPQHLEGGRCC